MVSGTRRNMWTAFRQMMRMPKFNMSTDEAQKLQEKVNELVFKLFVATGLVTLLEDGIIKAARGITTMDELLRSLPRLQNPRPLAELKRIIGG